MSEKLDAYLTNISDAFRNLGTSLVFNHEPKRVRTSVHLLSIVGGTFERCLNRVIEWCDQPDSSINSQGDGRGFLFLVKDS